MNMYEDYFNYMKEYEPLINKINESNSHILFCISDCIKVTDYIYQLYLDKETISSELEEIFEVGFGYLSNVLHDLQTYYEEYFLKNIDVFNYYAELIIYSIYLDDYICYLEADELLTDNDLTKLDEILKQIDDHLLKKLPYDQAYIEKIENDVASIAPNDSDFKPVYIVFSMILEEIDA